MKFNAFSSMGPIQVIAREYSIEGLSDLLETGERYRKVRRLCWGFPRSCIAVPYMGATKILAFGRSPLEVKAGNLKAVFTCEKKVNTKEPAMREALREAIGVILDNRIKKMGFKRFRGFFVAGNYAVVETDEGPPLRVYGSGARKTVEILDDGYSLIWIDPKARVELTAGDYISWALKFGLAEESIEDELLGTRVTVAPFLSSGKIVGIEWGQKAGNVTLEGGIGLVDYWKSKHGHMVNPEETPIIKVKLSNGLELLYPPSKVYLSIKGESIPQEARSEFAYPSVVRVRKTLDFAAQLFKDEFSLGDSKIGFYSNFSTAEYLKRLGKIVGEGKLQRPELRMGMGTTKTPLDLKRLGPYSGPKNIPIAYVMPKGALDIGRLHESLNKYAEDLRIGSLEKAGMVEIRGPSGSLTWNDYWRAAKTASRILREYESRRGKGTGEGMVLSILKGLAEVYAGSKSGAHSQSMRIQNLRLSTAWKIIQGKYFMAYNLLTQIYTKSLVGGEALWILSKPAGGMEGTAYIGYDVSRRIDKETGMKREAAATACLVDGQGRYLMSRFYSSQRGEDLDAQAANQLIFEAADEAYRNFQQLGKEFRRLVIFKDGVIKPMAAAKIKEGAIKAGKAITKDPELPQEITIELVGVVKRGIERMYSKEGYNVEEGSYALLSDNTALLVSSSLGRLMTRVTAQTTRIEPKFRITVRDGDVIEEKTDIERILREFYDLTSLDWASLYHMPKLPIVLRIVQALGEQYTMNIPEPVYSPL